MYKYLERTLCSRLIARTIRGLSDLLISFAFHLIIWWVIYPVQVPVWTQYWIQVRVHSKKKQQKVSEFTSRSPTCWNFNSSSNFKATATGDYYPLQGVHRIQTTFQGIVYLRPRIAPYVACSPIFSGAPGAVEIHRCIVCVDTYRFLIYGWNYPERSPRNQLLRQIKPSTSWHGEIVVFTLGKRVPIMSSPSSIKRSYHETAIKLWVPNIFHIATLSLIWA